MQLRDCKAEAVICELNQAMNNSKCIGKRLHVPYLPTSDEGQLDAQGINGTAVSQSGILDIFFAGQWGN